MGSCVTDSEMRGLFYPFLKFPTPTQYFLAWDVKNRAHFLLWLEVDIGRLGEALFLGGQPWPRGEEIFISRTLRLLHIVFCISLFSEFFSWIRNIDLASWSAVLAKPSWRLYGLRPLMRQGEGSEEIKRCAPGQPA